MDPISQGALGAVVSPLAAPPKRLRAFIVLGALSGMAPDLDVFIRSETDPLLFLEFHRQFTHSLIFIPLGAALCALVLYPLVKRALGLRQAYLACLLGYATHGLLDACTSYGTQLLWPFSSARVAWNNVSVVDPLFTLPLLGLVIACLVTRKQRFAVAGVTWALVYLAFGAVQHERAMSAATALAATRGHAVVRMQAKPGFANLVVWKVVYEFEGRFYVDAVRVGWISSVCGGESVARLDLNRHFAWLAENSQQHRDVDRFRRFSGDHLAVDDADPSRIVDIRYSMLPNKIDALWGIRLDEFASTGSHAAFFTERGGGTDRLARLWEMIRGRTCRGSGANTSE